MRPPVGFADSPPQEGESRAPARQGVAHTGLFVQSRRFRKLGCGPETMGSFPIAAAAVFEALQFVHYGSLKIILETGPRERVHRHLVWNRFREDVRQWLSAVGVIHRVGP